MISNNTFSCYSDTYNAIPIVLVIVLKWKEATFYNDYWLG